MLGIVNPDFPRFILDYIAGPTPGAHVRHLLAPVLREEEAVRVYGVAAGRDV